MASEENAPKSPTKAAGHAPARAPQMRGFQPCSQPTVRTDERRSHPRPPSGPPGSPLWRQQRPLVRSGRAWRPPRVPK